MSVRALIPNRTALLVAAIGVFSAAVCGLAQDRKATRSDKSDLVSQQEPEHDIRAGLLGGITIEDLSETRDRPLFTPVRHPPPPPPPPPPPRPPKVKVEKPPPPVKPPNPPTLRLVGVILTEKTKLALLLDQQRVVQRVGVGDEIGGWSVVKLEPQEVELKLNDQKSVYRIFDPDTIMEPPSRTEIRRGRRR